MDEQLENLQEAAEAPQSASVDGQSVSEHSLSERIKADQYIRGQQAMEGTNSAGGAKSGWNTLRPARFVPPGGH